ncbi:unnamed protein product [Symbiodinium sp. CCMP2592]|nr:unnamed protein product [Symbiodinium sp. CCMP2592]
MARASQRQMSCHEHAEKLTLALLVLGSLAVVVYAGDSFLSASEQVERSHGKPLAMLLLSSGVFVLIGAMIMIQAFAGWSCRSTTESTVDRDNTDDWGWSQGDVLPALRSSRQYPNQGSRCLIWASCTYQELGADVSAFHTVYPVGNHKLGKGSPVSILPAVPVVHCSTCVCVGIPFTEDALKAGPYPARRLLVHALCAAKAWSCGRCEFHRRHSWWWLGNHPFDAGLGMWLAGRLFGPEEVIPLHRFHKGKQKLPLDGIVARASRTT